MSRHSRAVAATADDVLHSRSIQASELTADQRLRELAGLLAAGVLRLHKRRLHSGSPRPTARKSAEKICRSTP